MVIGFTGTRDGMTGVQMQALVRLLGHLGVTAFHHGDCLGADDEAAELVANHWPAARIVAHPPVNDALRARNPQAHEVRPPRDYHLRNADIVRESQALVACPAEMTEQARGGTWQTVRLARKAGKATVIIRPDGTSGPTPLPLP